MKRKTKKFDIKKISIKDFVIICFIGCIISCLGMIIFTDFSFFFSICTIICFLALLMSLSLPIKQNLEGFAIFTGIVIIILSLIGIPFVISNSNILVKMEVNDIQTAKIFAIFSIPSLLVGIDLLVIYFLKLKFKKHNDVYYIIFGLISIFISLFLLYRIKYL